MESSNKFNFVERLSHKADGLNGRLEKNPWTNPRVPRVLMLSCGYGEGSGVATVTKELSETLNEQGKVAVDVVTFWAWSRKGEKPCQFIERGKRRSFQTLEDFLQSRPPKYDVLHFQNPGFGDHYLESLPSNRGRFRDILRYFGSTYNVMTTHSLASIPQAQGYFHAGQLAAERQVMEAADVIVHLTEEQRAEANKTHPVWASRTVVIGNGTNYPVKSFRNDIQMRYLRRKIAGNAKEVGLYFGRLSREKGIYELVEALPYVRKADPYFKLLIAGNRGDVHEERVQEKLHLRGMREGRDYALLGWITNPREKQLLLQAVDFLIMPSHWEHFPMSALEAMIQGTPVLITNVPGPRSVFHLDDHAQQLALPIAEPSPPEIVETVQYALHHQQDLGTIAARAQQQVRREFTWSKIAQQYAALYQWKGTAVSRRYDAGIVIPTYNSLGTLKATIRSALQQDFTGKFSVVVVDDGSTDGTFEAVQQSFAEELRYVENEREHREVNPRGKIYLLRIPNRHVAAARNTGLKVLESLGCEYFMPQDADDMALPDKLRHLVEYAEAHPTKGLVHAKSHTISTEGIWLSPQESPWERYYTNPWYIWNDGPEGMWARALREGFQRGDLEKANYIHNHTVLLRRGALVSLNWNLYPEGVRFAEDWEFHQKLERQGIQFGFLDNYVAISRYHPFGLTGSVEKKSALELAQEARDTENKLLYLVAAYHDSSQAWLPEVEEDFTGWLREVADTWQKAYEKRDFEQAQRCAYYLYLLAPCSQNDAVLQQTWGELLFHYRFERDFALQMDNTDEALNYGKKAYALSGCSKEDTQKLIFLHTGE